MVLSMTTRAVSLLERIVRLITAICGSSPSDIGQFPVVVVWRWMTRQARCVFVDLPVLLPGCAHDATSAEPFLKPLIRYWWHLPHRQVCD